MRCSIASNFFTMSSPDAVDGADAKGCVEEGCVDDGCDDEGCPAEGGDEGCEGCVAFCDEDCDGVEPGVAAPGAAGFAPPWKPGITPSWANAVPPPVIAVASKSAASLVRWLLRWP
jgi:hypothetical protein